jgi:hypothetical protein
MAELFTICFHTCTRSQQRYHHMISEAYPCFSMTFRPCRNCEQCIAVEAAEAAAQAANEDTQLALFTKLGGSL